MGTVLHVHLYGTLIEWGLAVLQKARAQFKLTVDEVLLHQRQRQS